MASERHIREARKWRRKQAKLVRAGVDAAARARELVVAEQRAHQARAQAQFDAERAALDAPVVVV